MKTEFKDQTGAVINHLDLIYMPDCEHPAEQMLVIDNHLCWANGVRVEKNNNLHKYWRIKKML